MAKRRGEDTLLCSSPSKRCCRSLCSVDMQLGSVAPAGGVSPPSLLALLGGRSRKRPCYFDEMDKEEEDAAAAAAAAAAHRKATLWDTRTVFTVHTSGSFQERRSCSALAASKKRHRESCVSSETVVSKAKEKAEEDTNTEDSTYNSFQYWRVPLPELDLSLLEESSDTPQTKNKSKVKESSSDAMET